MQIYVAKNGVQTGPFTEEQLDGQLANGEVLPTDLAWRAGLTDWQPVQIVRGIDQPPPLPVAGASTLPVPPWQDEIPTGVGGWLAVFCIVLVIIRPLITIPRMVGVWRMSEATFSRYPALQTALLCEDAGSIILVIYGFVVGCLIWRGSPRGRRLARQFLLLNLLGFFALEFVVLLMTTSLPSNIVAGGIRGALGAGVRTVVFTLIWWCYFTGSKRVRATYGDEGA